MTYSETAIVDTIERLAGVSVDDLTQAELDAIDQYHAGGHDAVARLLPALDLRPGTTALDVGAGFGGAARQLARTTGCRVVGVDVTADYVTAANELTRRAGLADRVSFRHVDIADLGRSDFDAAYTIHVQMNVADKATFYGQIGAHLRPGGRLAIFEVCRGVGTPTLPLPWSLDGSDSYLATADDLRAMITDCGFETVEWSDDGEWIKQWFADAGRRLMADPARASLPALLTDGPTRMVNFAAAVANGAVTIRRGAFVRA